MSKDYKHEIGYETLLSDFRRYQKQTPRGVGIAKKGQNIYLQFKTPNTARKQYACGCSFTLDGMVDALKKSNKVAEKLKSLDSETEFWLWYDKEIKEESRLKDDLITFAEAIAKVEDDFWNRPSRTKRKRDKNNHSDLSTWKETYGRFYSFLPQEKIIDYQSIESVLKRWTKGKRSYRYAVSAFKKMCRLIKRSDIVELLDEQNILQTEFIELQTITLDDFLNWKDKILGVTASLHPNTQLATRRAWLWAFGIQVVYGLRIHEVFAIANLDKPYEAKDRIVIPALNDPDNVDNLIVIIGETVIGTTTKTSYRIARPIIPPKYPDLLERLDIKTPFLPTNRPTSSNPDTIRKFFTRKARRRLTDWNAPFTQTHALRHLANINGMQAGIPLEVRAQSMGHTPAMNDSVYKKRQSTQTTIDLLLNSNTQAIDFVTALAEAKKLVRENESDKEIISRLLSIIYQKNEKEINKLL